MLSLTVLFLGQLSWADPLAPPEAAVLTTRLLDGRFPENYEIGLRARVNGPKDCSMRLHCQEREIPDGQRA
jgi:hypothetical protein